MNRKLEFTNDLIFKEEIDKYVIVFFIQSILDLDNFQKAVIQFFNFVKNAQQIHEFIFHAWVSCPHKISNFEANQIDISKFLKIGLPQLLVVLMILVEFIHVFAGIVRNWQQGVNQAVEIFEDVLADDLLKTTCKNADICVLLYVFPLEDLLGKCTL